MVLLELLTPSDSADGTFLFRRTRADNTNRFILDVVIGHEVKHFLLMRPSNEHDFELDGNVLPKTPDVEEAIHYLHLPCLFFRKPLTLGVTCVRRVCSSSFDIIITHVC